MPELNNGGIPISGTMTPTSSKDTYPTHDATWGVGGGREVETKDDMHAITDLRRSEGMTVFVRQERAEYRLLGGITNDHWVKQSTGGKSAFDVAVDEGFTGTEKEWLETLKPTVKIKQVIVLSPDQQPYVRNVGTDSELILEIGIPQGLQGLPGTPGDPGQDGKDGKDGKNGENAVAATNPRGNFTRYADPAYKAKDYVTYADGNAYVCLKDNETNEPPTPGSTNDYWQLIALQGAQGKPGDKGDTPIIKIGTITLLEPGSQPYVTNTGTVSEPVFNFGLVKGTKGDPGQEGIAATITVNETIELIDGNDAVPTVTNTGTTSAAVLKFKFPKKIFTSASGDGGSVKYTDTKPTTVAIGGLPKGYTPPEGGEDLATLLSLILHQYQEPKFTSFSLTGVKTKYEVGDTIAANRTATFTIENKNELKEDSLVIKQDGVIVAQNFENETPVNTTSKAFTMTNTGSVIFTIEGKNSKNENMTPSKFTVSFAFAVYYGESTDTTLSGDAVKLLRVKDTSDTGSNRTISYKGGGYKYLAVPKSITQPKTFKDTSTNMDVPFEPAYELIVTNTFGIDCSYMVYRTINMLGGDTTIKFS